MFKKVLDYFVSKKVNKNPLFQVAKKASDEALERTKLSRKQMAINIDEIAKEVNEIILSEDRFNILRQKIAGSVLGYAQFHVVMIDKKKDNKETLVGLPGISGDLTKHILQIAETNEEMQEEIHGWQDPTMKNDFTFMKGYFLSKYHIWYWRHAIFDALRVETEDYNKNLDKDWSKPFLYSICASEEYNYREKLNLKQELDGMQSFKNSTFLDLVIKGEKYPDLAFYKMYKEDIESKKLYYHGNKD